jgi:hypothetical protein
MGKIAEALRANLRELALADARVLRELDGALPAASSPSPAPVAGLPDGLERLTVRELKALGKERGLKGCGSLTKAALIERLRRSAPHLHPPKVTPPTVTPSTVPPSMVTPPSVTPPPPGPQPAPTSPPLLSPPSDLTRIEARLDRLESLLRSIATHLGVPA